MEVEFGTTGNIRFLDPSQVTMRDSEGNIILCKCGKPAGSMISGKNAFLAHCSDCSPLGNGAAEFIYKQSAPSLERLQELRDIGFNC